MPASAQGFLTAEMLASDAGQNLLINQCSNCGLVQLDNPPVDYYREVIRAAAFSNEMRKFRLQQLKDWVGTYQLNQQKVLEIGCGKGEYLSLLKAAGANAFGLEYSVQAISDCQLEGLQVFQGYLGEYQLQNLPKDFSGFICLNFMEHWPNPNASLSELKAHLSAGAIGLIEVPNFDMIIEKGLFSEFISDHLLYFTQDTLRFTLQKNGFEVLACKPVWQDYILSAVVRKREPTDLTHFNQFHRGISASLNAFISAFDKGKVAIWGAGHQSLAVISLANLADKIAYIIDSATFKQNKYTPATHLPIVAPNHLKKEPVDAVIIMAASYSDEVARVIRDEYSQAIKVVILRDDGLEEVN